uniref:Uncharacterized protein n=1 Tax=Tetranychus urticae TaxID=32264 RepID=T1KZ29_TETUR
MLSRCSLFKTYLTPGHLRYIHASRARFNAQEGPFERFKDYLSKRMTPDMPTKFMMPAIAIWAFTMMFITGGVHHPPPGEGHGHDHH